MKRKRRKVRKLAADHVSAQELRDAPVFEYTMLDAAYAIAGLELRMAMSRRGRKLYPPVAVEGSLW